MKSRDCTSNNQVKVTDIVRYGTLSKSTDMRRLTTGIRSEKSVVTRFRRCANFIDCTYAYLESVLLTQYCTGGKIETNEMGRACGAYGGG